MRTSIQFDPLVLPVSLPRTGYDAPFAVLGAFHQQAQRMLGLLTQLQRRGLQSGWSLGLAEAAQQLIRYFDRNSPLHFHDVEEHVFPHLLATSQASMRLMVRQLKQGHQDIARAWAPCREVLMALTHEPGPGGLVFGPPQMLVLNRFMALYRQHLEYEDGCVYPAARAQLKPLALLAMGRDMARRWQLRSE